MGNRNGSETEEGMVTSSSPSGTEGNISMQQPPPDSSTGGTTRPSTWQLIKQGYNEMVNAIIRPPRAEYSVDLLGPTEFTIQQLGFKREDLELTNELGKRLVCSHWKPMDRFRVKSEMPCIVYLHGNASCRGEALECLPSILTAGFTLFSLDLSGSGKSEGDYISLGWFERDDVKTVIEYLRSCKDVSTIGLWGRSMGAVTALMHGCRDPSIACLVLDSPFASLQQLARELVDEAQISIPKFAVGIALRMVRSSVKARANFDISRLETVKYAEECFIPALFGCAKNDNFIRAHHSQQIYDTYGGEKKLLTFDGDHNTSREGFFLHSASIFLTNAMMTGSDSKTSPPSTRLQEPPINSDAATSLPRFSMPVPLSESGGGLGIRVGIPGSESDADNRMLSGQNYDYYEEAMIRHAIELSLADTKLQDVGDKKVDENDALQTQGKVHAKLSSNQDECSKDAGTLNDTIDSLGEEQDPEQFVSEGPQTS